MRWLVEKTNKGDALFGFLPISSARAPEAQSRIQAAVKRGFQTRDAELALARLLGDLADNGSNKTFARYRTKQVG